MRVFAARWKLATMPDPFGQGTPATAPIPIGPASSAARRVLLMTHKAPEVTSGALPTVLAILEERGVEVLVPPAEVVKHPRLVEYTTSDGAELKGGGEDLILVLGGDGSILRALAREAGSGAPVIGVNYGRVGFLTTIERDELEAGLRRVLSGDFVIIALPSLTVDWSDGWVSAVNDLALLRGGESRIADLSFAIDGERVANVRCDGLVASTPVGSTAYNLAAGGPTVSWRVRCFVLSFLAGHHLDTRPLVIAPEERLTITNSAVVGACDILADGVKVGSLAPGRAVTVGLGGSEVHLATFPEASFFRRYREKFGR
jgi:NAD+ kinase